MPPGLAVAAGPFIWSPPELSPAGSEPRGDSAKLRAHFISRHTSLVGIIQRFLSHHASPVDIDHSSSASEAVADGSDRRRQSARVDRCRRRLISRFIFIITPISRRHLDDNARLRPTTHSRCMSLTKWSPMLLYYLRFLAYKFDDALICVGGSMNCCMYKLDIIWRGWTFIKPLCI